MRLSTESTLPVNSQVFHYSRSLDELIRYGKFDPARSRHLGAMYFTPERTITSNCVATTSEDLRLFDFTELPKEELATLEELGNGDFWAGALSLGYEGRLFLTADPFAKIAEGQYCHELVIFKDGFTKINNLRRIS